MKYWIALEIIAIPEGTDISIINSSLNEIYNLTPEQIKDKFQIGYIFGIRSDLVHNGKQFSVDGLLLKYLEAVFVDVLLSKLQIDSQYRSENVLKEIKVPIKEFLAKLRKP